MRSLHIIGSRRLGGAENFFLRLLPALSGHTGHEVIAVTRRNSLVDIHIDPTIQKHTVALRNGWDITSVLAIRRLVRVVRPDVVQTYMGRSTRLTRLPKGSAAIHVARLGGYYKIDGYYRHASAWIGNTRGICDYLIREGLPPGRVFQIGNFVPHPLPTPAEKLLHLREALNIPQDAQVVFSLGRFVEQKGFYDLLTAFSKLSPTLDDRPRFLLLAGDGPLRSALQKHAKELSIESRIRFVGWTTNPTGLFHLSDVFVCPSWEEPLGNVILEAWAHGVPVLSTLTDGSQELITPDTDGLLCPIASPMALSSRIAELLAAPPKQLQRMIDAGYAVVRTRHSQSIVTSQYNDLYEHLLVGGCRDSATRNSDFDGLDLVPIKRIPDTTKREAEIKT